MLRWIRLLMLMAIIMILGLNWAAAGIEEVVGPGLWKAIDCTLVPQGAQIQLLGKTYLIDYGPLIDAFYEAYELVDEVKLQGNKLVDKGKIYATRILENNWFPGEDDGLILIAE